MRYPMVFAASCWDDNECEWVIQKVFMDRKEAIEYAQSKVETAVRCNRPFEWWRVEEYELTPCSKGNVIWGCPKGIRGGACC